VQLLFWCLPGGKVEANESSETALIRLITKQLGTKPKLGDLIKTYEYLHRDQLRLELFYTVSNVTSLLHCSLTDAGQREYDELAWINPKKMPDLRPEFLQTQKV
jgi:ADP-ribose pyrophosphatase YjhB (NUDIX family)